MPKNAVHANEDAAAPNSSSPLNYNTTYRCRQLHAVSRIILNEQIQGAPVKIVFRSSGLKAKITF